MEKLKLIPFTIDKRHRENDGVSFYVSIHWQVFNYDAQTKIFEQTVSVHWEVLQTFYQKYDSGVCRKGIYR